MLNGAEANIPALQSKI